MDYPRVMESIYGQMGADMMGNSNKAWEMGKASGYQKRRESNIKGNMFLIRNVAMESFSGLIKTICIKDILKMT